MVTDEELGDANGLLQSTNQGIRLLAPLVGAGLYAAIGGGAVAAVDAATFLVSALLLLGVHAPAIPVGEEPDFWAELSAGLRHIVHTADIRRLMIATAAVTFIAGVIMRLTTMHRRRELMPRDGFLLVFMVWTILLAFATLPLWAHLLQL